MSPSRRKSGLPAGEPKEIDDCDTTSGEGYARGKNEYSQNRESPEQRSAVPFSNIPHFGPVGSVMKQWNEL